MNSKEKLQYLLEKYIKEKYDVNSFCEQFTVIYNLDTDYSTLSTVENSLFKELCEFTARYSPFEDDLAISNVYVNENQIRNKANDVYSKLMTDITN
ncbi:hypothetical protein [Clostridium aciditolerans]|uniref:Colicin D immunity protein domain-containing protein n=1 Tax=Clostridium aciditolerans TaxID=339861 RepID=A0A934M598_9CLOT|nr:hypothetical protein [Clostridium aciditolerans]MBI6871801.1 hypothetical protein [Clostridium aciditolerans]